MLCRQLPRWVFSSERAIGVFRWPRRRDRDALWADDLVIVCRNGTADEALPAMRASMARLKRTVNEQPT